MAKKKPRARRGETLTEVLVAMLVVSMSICLLAGMVSTSMSINGKMREADQGADGFYPALAGAETHTFDHTTDTSITVRTTSQSPAVPSVTLTGNIYRHVESGVGGLTVYGREG